MDMLQAMNTGHDGSLSTGHGNSPADMIRRIETMVLMGMTINLEAVRGQIAGGLDIIIHLGRLRDGSRKVLEISEVSGMRDNEIVLNPLYEYEEEAGEKTKQGNMTEQHLGKQQINKEEIKGGKIKGSLKRTGNKLQHTEKLMRAGIDIS